MRNLYYRILHLLIIKPYLHLAISILIILIIKVIFIQTVYAVQYCEDEIPHLRFEQIRRTGEYSTNVNDNEIQELEIMPHYNYQQIIKDIIQIKDESTSEYELINRTLDYIREIIPREILALNHEDLERNDSAFNQYMSQFISNCPRQTEIQKISQNIFLTALSVHTSINMLEEAIPINLIQEVYMDTLQKMLKDDLSQPELLVFRNK